MATRWKLMNLFGIVVIVLNLAACGGKEDESQVRDAVEEVVTKDFKIYESAKESIGEIQKTSQENRQQQLDLLK